jgi:hypothetical protein
MGGTTLSLRDLAEAAAPTWPADDPATRAFSDACSPERVLALLDVADAAGGTHQIRATGKTKWWREDGMAGASVADNSLRAALARWRVLGG